MTLENQRTSSELIFELLIYLLTSRSDYHLTSLYNIHTLSSKQVMRILKYIKWKRLS